MPTPIYFDGTKVRFEDVPEGLNKAKNAVISPKTLPATIEVEKEKTKTDTKKQTIFFNIKKAQQICWAFFLCIINICLNTII